MTPLSSRPTSNAAKDVSRPGLSAWGASQSRGSHRELSPISTTFNQSRSSTASQDFNLRSPLSPVGSVTSLNSAAAPGSRHSARSPSITSPPPGITPPPAAARSRNIASFSNNHQTSAVAAASGLGGTGSSSGGGPSRTFRASPSLSQSSYNPPTPTSATASSSSGQSGSVNRIVTSQIFILLSTIKDIDKDKAKWDTEARKIRELVESNGMEVFEKYLRRLIVNNAGTIWSTSRSEPSGNYPMLVSEIKKITKDSLQATRIVESIENGDSEVFKDFDLSTFMEHFNMNAVEKITLASAFKKSSKSDLRTKADAIISNNIQNFLEIVSRSLPANGPPNDEDDLIATVIDRLAQHPPRNWNAEVQGRLHQALLMRYEHTGKAVPWTITSAFYMFNLAASENALINLLKRAGSKSTETPAAARQTVDLADRQDLTAEQIAGAILYMVISRNEPPYEPQHFVSAIKESKAGQSVDWQRVIRWFDRDLLTITKDQFKQIYDCLLPLAREDEAIDLQLLWGGSWTFETAQLSFVSAFLSHSQDDIDASLVPNLRTAFSLKDFEDAPMDVQTFAAEAVRHPYASLDAITALLKLAFEDHTMYENALNNLIIERAVNTNLALFVGAASAVEARWSQVQDMAIKTLFDKILVQITRDPAAEVNRESRFALHLLWRNHKLFVANSIYKFYQQKAFLQLDVILDIAQDHGMLEDLVSAKNQLSLDLAALAHGRQLFDIEAWLQQISSEMSAETITPALIEFLNAKISDDVAVHKEGADPTTFPLRVRTAHALLTFLGKQNLHEDERIDIQRAAMNAYPRLINYDQGQDFDDIIDANGALGNALPPEADSQMQEYYRMMWNGEKGVQDIMSVLCRLKTSKSPPDQDLFACMVFGLFDEFHCFVQYPQKALADTALLFGSIIDMKLLSNIALQVAISMVLESVRTNKPDDLMFKFGLQALVRFQGRLEEWGRLCETLLEIEGLKGTEIYPALEDITQRRQERLDDADVVPDDGDAADDFLAPEPGVPEFASLGMDPLPQDDFAEDPNDTVQEAILFSLNNLTDLNLANKATDMKSNIRPEHHQWLAKYLVENRIKHQSNYQPLYMSLLDSFDDATLWSAVLRSTLSNSIKMLNAESTMGSSNERTLLKNLGGFLGSMTLARNQSVKYRNISFRDLLVEAKDTQRLLVAIPFTCKVLASVAHSVVFRPPCAWTMEILEVLVELYLFADLKLNLKFEIEVLCKALSIDHTDIEPAVIIRSRPSPDQDLLPSALTDGLDAFADTSLVGLNRRMGDHRFSPATIITQELASVLRYNYPTPIADPEVQDQIRSLLTDATERAVADIIGAVVERSVTIASIAACQITMKDFALESDVNKLRESAHTAVRSLAGSLAAVTCKEPLRNQMSTNVHQLRNAIHETLLPTGYMQMFVNDNLDNVCGVVQKAAADASVAEIDIQLEDAGAVRERQNADFMQGRQVSNWSSFIPAPYKMTSNGMTREQLSIYDDFDRNTRETFAHTLQDGNRPLHDVLQDQFAPTFTSNDHVANHSLGQHRTSESSRNQPVINGYANMPNGTNLEDRIIEAVNVFADTAKALADQHSLEELLRSQGVKQTLSQLSELLESDEAQLAPPMVTSAARQVARLLHSVGGPPQLLELLALVLSSTCRADRSETTREIVMYWCNDLGPRFLQTPVTAALVRTGLVDKQRLDLAIASGLMEDRYESFVFLRDLVDKLLLTLQPTLFRSDLANSIMAMSQCALAGQNTDIAEEIVERLGGTSVLPDSFRHDAKETEEIQLSYVFEEWVRFQANIHQALPPASFVHQLHEQRVFSHQERLAEFLKASILACIKTCEIEDSQQSETFEETLNKSDALARLLVLMVEFQPKINGSITGGKLGWLETALSCVVMTFVQCFKEGLGAWAHRPFFRLYSALAFELPGLEFIGHDDRNAPLLLLSKSLLLLEPTTFPTFAFSSLSLISHRTLMPTLVRDSGEGGRHLYCQLINGHVAYVRDLIEKGDAGLATKDYYRGVIRLLLVLHHDFPDFVADYAFQLLRAMPTVCSQMRELIVTASPSAHTTDPFIEGLAIESLADAKWAPKMLGDFPSTITAAGLDGELASFSSKGGSVSSTVDAVARAVSGLASSHNASNTAVDHELIDALLIDLPQRLNQHSPTLLFAEAHSVVNLLTSLAQRLDVEARYHLLSSMTNHLRFPNSYTAFYSQMILHLYRSEQLDQAAQLENQQIILRVLMERVIPQRPQSWGLLKTLVDLLRTANAGVFDLAIVKAPEIDQMLSHVLDRARAGYQP